MTLAMAGAMNDIQIKSPNLLALALQLRLLKPKALNPCPRSWYGLVHKAEHFTNARRTDLRD